jgi:hypothetical protein
MIVIITENTPSEKLPNRSVVWLRLAMNLFSSRQG